MKRIIGVSPPLNEAVSAEVQERIILPDWVEFQDIYCVQQTNTDGPAYTEFGFDVGSGIDWIGVEIVDADAFRVAEQIARVLRSKGDDVTTLEGVFPTDFQTPIFGSRWNDMVDEAKFRKSPPEQT